jgi:alpha-N-arabinofuranosidase
MEWDRTVLEAIGAGAEYVSLHLYVGNPKQDTADYLAVTNAVDQRIEEMDAVCRYVQARTRSKKRHYLCFDEWNVWYRTQNAESINGHGKFAQHLGEEEYNLEDALVVAGFLNSFIRHADILKIANLAQIVNNLPPILTRGDDLLVQSTYYPLLMFAGRRDGVSITPIVQGPGYESPSYGFVRTIDTSAILGDGVLHTFLINRSMEEAAAVEIILRGAELAGVQSAELVSGPDAAAQNTFDQPDIISCRPFSGIEIRDGRAALRLPPLSFAAVTFRLAGSGTESSATPE